MLRSSLLCHYICIAPHYSSFRSFPGDLVVTSKSIEELTVD